MAVHFNGAEVRRQRAGGDWTLDFVVPMRDLDGIEIHVGPQGPLIDASGCGVLLLWSEAAARGGQAQFYGSIEGIFWGTREADVVEVVLEGRDQRADLTGGGTFVFREVLPGLREVVVRTADEIVGRDTVRVYAFAKSAIDISIR